MEWDGRCRRQMGEEGSRRRQISDKYVWEKTFWFEIQDKDFAEVTKNVDDCLMRKFEGLEGKINAMNRCHDERCQKLRRQRRGGGEGFNIRCIANPRWRLKMFKVKLSQRRSWMMKTTQLPTKPNQLWVRIQLSHGYLLELLALQSALGWKAFQVESSPSEHQIIACESVAVLHPSVQLTSVQMSIQSQST